MRYQGKVTNWNDDKGFGFVEPNGGGDRAFVHIKSFVRGSRRPVDGDEISYEMVKGSDGRYKAAKTRFTQDSKQRKKVHRRSQGYSFGFGDFITIGFCIFLAAVTALGKVPFQISGIYVIASLVAFFAYALDKSAAQKNRWRTKESTLHLFALVGGWPGAFYAQKILRHKSSKAEFKNVFWGSVVMNVGAFSWLLMEGGGRLLHSVIGL
jgi:uncharacterized membrane protein YsdA (DUF1294 family)/cold shock CspA family protein